MTMTQNELITALRDQLANAVVPIDGYAVKELTVELANMKQSVSEENGKLRSFLKEGLKENQLNKKGYAIFRALYDASRSERVDQLRTLLPLILYGLDELGWLEHMTDLVSEAEGDDDHGDHPDRDEHDGGEIDPDEVGEAMDGIEEGVEDAGDGSDETDPENIPGNPAGA